jgi:nucleoside-diphosphate-sugar epimerase
MRVVVTGATGNAGTALLRALAAEPAVEDIVGVARRRPRTAAPKVTFQAADVSRDALAPLMRGADAVVHLAWLIQPSRDERVTRATNVDGSRRVFQAVAEAGVPRLVYASSVGAYAPGPKDRRVGEDWPATGIRSSFYSRHKAAVEAQIVRFTREHPEIRVAWLRPGLIFQRDAASGIRRLFAGPFLPSPLLRRDLVPVVPDHARLRVQAVHADDVADAYRRAILDDDARGAYNVAAEPVLDGPAFARALGAIRVPVPARVLRAGAWLTWQARLQPTPPGWVDMGLGVPLMDVSRAADELGWSARQSADQAFLQLFDGMRERAGADTPPLHPRTGGFARVRELLTGVGGRSR